MRFVFLLSIPLLFFSLFGFALAQTKVIENSGFVPGNLWFSKTPTSVGETVQIYTLVWNGSSNDITGTVSFFDNDSVIEKKDFILAGEGSSKILSVPWKVGDGYHKIYAQITDSIGGLRGTKAISVSLQYTKTIEEERFLDTPKDNSAAATLPESYVDDKVNLAKSYLEVNLPKPAVSAAKFVADNLETIRSEAHDWSGQTIKKLKTDLDSSAAKSEETKSEKSGGKNNDNGFDVGGPFKYAAIALLSAGDYVFGNSWLFYGLGAIAVFFVLRFIKRKFFF